MRILWVGTKAPKPPVDGGRLVALETVRALATEGCSVTVAVPDDGSFGGGAEAGHAGGQPAPGWELVRVPVRPRGAAITLVWSLLSHRPFSIVRHSHPQLRAEVDRLAGSREWDAVHVEQLQAVPQVIGTRAESLPRVLRAQNVESDLWTGGRSLARPLAPWLALESSKLRRFEGRAVGWAHRTVALSREDAVRLRTLGGAEAVVVAVPPPFPGRLPGRAAPLEGSPPLVVLGSAGWAPNRDAVEWLLTEIWPAIERSLPEAVLHLFGAGAGSGADGVPGVHLHPDLADSREAFAPGSILLVPLRVGSGVRMKILEGWARRVPVVATPEAAAGLRAEDGRELLLASETEGIVRAIARLAGSEDLRRELVRGGATALAERHDPSAVAKALIEVYVQARETMAR